MSPRAPDREQATRQARARGSRGPVTREAWPVEEQRRRAVHCASACVGKTWRQIAAGAVGACSELLCCIRPIAFAGILATACHCGSGSQPGAESGDAGDTLDGAHDANRPPDAGPTPAPGDARRNDVGPSDGGDLADADAAPGEWGPHSPAVGEWKRFPGAPDWCNLRIAVDPTGSVPEITWEPCGPGQAGCWRHVADWCPTKSECLFVGSNMPATIDGVLHFTIGRKYEYPIDVPDQEKQYYSLLAVQPLEGKAKYANILRENHIAAPTPSGRKWCVGGLGMSGTRLAGAIDFHDFTDGGSQFDFDDYYRATSTTLWWFDWAKPDDMIVRPVSHSDFGGIGPASAEPYGKMIFGEMIRGPLQAVTVAIDTTTGKANQPFEHAYMVPLRDPVPVDDGAFVNNQTEYTGLWFLPNWDWARCLWQPEIGRTMFRHSVDRAANNDLVWADSDEATGSDYSLWDSRFATTADELGARKVASLPKLRGGQFAANAGVVLWLDDQGVARIVRRSDGKGWQVPKTKGVTYTNVIWVDDEHLWLGADMAEGRFAGEKTNAFIRYDRSVLGEPTLGNGLGSAGEPGAAKAAQSTAARKRPPLDPRTIRRTRR